MLGATPWLPRGMSFLSGLPSPVRKRRVLLPIQVYVDDSGGKGQGPVFVFAGLVASAETWAAFADEWQDCLDEKPAISHFKMREAASLQEEFRHWQPKVRDEKVRRLARVVDRYVSALLYFVLDLTGFKDVIAPRFPKPFNQVYFWPFQFMVMLAAHDVIWRSLTGRFEQRITEPFEMIFDEQVVFGPRARLWYPYAKCLLHPAIQAVMPTEPIFRSDREFLPLQAADMFAWWLRRNMSGCSQPFPWLESETPSVARSPFSKYFTKERMEQVWSDPNYEIPPELFERERNFLDTL